MRTKTNDQIQESLLQLEGQLKVLKITSADIPEIVDSMIQEKIEKYIKGRFESYDVEDLIELKNLASSKKKIQTWK